MMTISEITQDLLNKLFNSNVIPRIQLNQEEQYVSEFAETDKIVIESISSCKKAVVGIDIYRYSQLPTEKQMFIPHLFDKMYEETWHLIKQNYVYLFQEYGNLLETDWEKYVDHNKHFISTGDGGFQILETPIHAIIFILTFATVLRLYNADLFMRKLFAKIGNIEVRYAITWDEIYKYKKNYYGASIINNSRIQSKDRMNRLIIDQNIYNWFQNRIIGIENLMTLGLEEIKGIKEFSSYDQHKIFEQNNALIHQRSPLQEVEGIKSIDVQKIGTIQQKQTFLEIYNLHIQAIILYRNLFEEEKIITLSVGNLNTAGIDNEET